MLRPDAQGDLPGEMIIDMNDYRSHFFPQTLEVKILNYSDNLSFFDRAIVPLVPVHRFAYGFLWSSITKCLKGGFIQYESISRVGGVFYGEIPSGNNFHSQGVDVVK